MTSTRTEELYPNPQIAQIINDLRDDIVLALETTDDDWAAILDWRINEAWDQLQTTVPMVDGIGLGRNT